MEEANKPVLTATPWRTSEAPGQTINGEKSLLKRPGSAALRLPDEGHLPSLDGATTWLNSPPLTAEGLRGKVVLINFWTYTCINWLRSLPYVRAWAEKYGEQDLVVIGVHSPEFAFEQDLANVRRSVQTMNVKYPVAVDNNYAIWQAFSNHYWPALYIADAKGHIRYHHFGEGNYSHTERVIQELLVEAGKDDSGDGLVLGEGQDIEAAADWASLRSFENYLGYERTENFASSGGAVLGRPHHYTGPARLPLNHWALTGDWTMGKSATVLNKPGGLLAYHFQARDLHLVMAPAVRGTSTRFRVRLEGNSPGASRGIDVDVEGFGTLEEQRLYQLIRQPKPITDRHFEIEFDNAGAEVFVFTFG